MRGSLAGTWLGHDGIEMRDAAQLKLLRRWRSYTDLFEVLRLDPQVNVHALGKGYVENGWYHTPDVESYAAMIADRRPNFIVEIGGGFSTLVARKTLDELHLGSTHLIVIDPQPRVDVREAADIVIPMRIEQAGLDAFSLADPVLLFIDSSHVARISGDVPFLYNKLIPNLACRSLVHVHDIFIPFDYRPDYHTRQYTEQYVLHALLTSTTRFRVEFASVYMSWRHPDEMRLTFGETVPSRHAGASLWFEVA